MAKREMLSQTLLVLRLSLLTNSTNSTYTFLQGQLIGPWIWLALIMVAVELYPLHHSLDNKSIKKCLFNLMRIALHTAAVSVLWKLSSTEQALVSSLHGQISVGLSMMQNSDKISLYVCIGVFIGVLLAIPIPQIEDHVVVLALLWPESIDLAAKILFHFI